MKMKRIIGKDSNAVYRVILRWLFTPPDERASSRDLAEDLGLTVCNLYQRVSRLKRMRGPRVVALRESMRRVAG